MANSRLNIFTDGACKGNPGPGGWAAVLIRSGEQQVISGNDPRTTNNRMELLAAIRGLEVGAGFKPAPTEIVVYSDSTYLINTMAKGWKRNANHDLWQRLDQLVEGRRVIWKWVRGHRGTPGNELADMVARREAGLVGAGFKPAPTATKKPLTTPLSPSSGEARKAGVGAQHAAPLRERQRARRSSL